MTKNAPTVAKAACKSCPYRADVPAGIWAAEEYTKLPTYDGEILDQVVKGGTALFLCHQQTGKLCSGWVGCHGPDNLLALRVHPVDPEVFEFEGSIPLFKSGAEAAIHGLSGIQHPDAKARRTIDSLVRKQERRELSRAKS
jgi:hypothetical protein